jgi:hypothetical protein
MGSLTPIFGRKTTFSVENDKIRRFGRKKTFSFLFIFWTSRYAQIRAVEFGGRRKRRRANGLVFKGVDI